MIAEEQNIWAKRYTLLLILKDMEYDVIYVSNLFAEEIYRQWKELEIDTDKVIFLYSNCKLQDMNKNYNFIKQILGEEYADIVAQRYHVVRGVEAYGDLLIKSANFIGGRGYEANDYVWIKSFELAVKEF